MAGEGSAMLKILLATLTGVVLASVAIATCGADPIQWEANGHWYEWVTGSYTWPDARAAAESMSWQGCPGHLVTLTTADESAFVFSALGGTNFGAWLGGYQDPQYEPDPLANWHWVTGEPWEYTNWAPGEPNDWNGGEFYLDYSGNGPYWNDKYWYEGGFIVEFEGPGLGACCFTHICVLLTEEDCTNNGGRFLGAGTTCDDDPCEDGTPARAMTWGAVKSTFGR